MARRARLFFPPPTRWAVQVIVTGARTDGQADVPAEETAPRQGTRVPSPHEDEGRPPRAGIPAGEGSKAPERLTPRPGRRGPRMISGATRFDAIQRSGQVRAHPLLLFRYLATEGDSVSWALSTGKRLGGAVVRNRVRRRLREALRALGPQIRGGWDIMVIARPGSVAASSKELHDAVLDLARRAGLLREPA